MKHLLVIADYDTTLLWAMAGAHTLEFSGDNLSDILSYLNKHHEEHQAALIGESVYNTAKQIIRLLSEYELPWIVLPDSGESAELGYKELARLSEEAIGIQLDFKK